MTNFEVIKSNYERIRNDLDSVGKSDVKIIAVTKTRSADEINFAINELGISAIGENRVQELLEKYDQLDFPKDRKIEIHLIGTLQSNKVKYIIDKVDMIQSLDSIKLAREIDKQAKKVGKIMDVLIEVNIGEEEQKGGVIPKDLDVFTDEIAKFDNIMVRGLMVIPPKSNDSEKNLQYFSETYKYFIDISSKNIHNISMSILSMGMSDTYVEGALAGATHVRIGTSLFGQRNYK